VRHSVLLVQDDDDLRTLYGFSLANSGLRVKAVRNGLEALTELQEQSPDVIVTDLAMPVIDGKSLIGIIKKKAELAAIPIIAMTAYGQNLQNFAKSAGADLAVEKPAEINSLCDLVNSVLPQL